MEGLVERSTWRLENEGKRDDGYVEGEGEGRYVRRRERKGRYVHCMCRPYLVSWSEAFSSMATSVGGGPFSLTEYTA